MSLKTWKEEFYPIDANKVSKEDALAHSLKKWIGLRPENLRKHYVSVSGISLYEVDLIEFESLEITGDSCALCCHHATMECEDCPLAKFRNGISCVKETENEISSPWWRFVYYCEVEPMITLLNRAMEKYGKPKTETIPE